MARVDGKVAVITGAARGVGLGIAHEFVDAGAKVIVADLEQGAIDEAVAELGPQSSGAVVDVTDNDAMTSLYEDIVRQHGHLDAVVANAGVGDSAPLGAITEEQFDFIFAVNAKGVLFTVQAALPVISDGGTFVIIGSTASTEALYGMSMYGGSKAAIRQFVRAWILDIREAKAGVRINLLSPGAIDTPSLRTALEGASGADQVQAKVDEMGAGNPIGRLGDPREIGKAAVFLSSDESSFITGVELFVDGGMAQSG